MPTTELWDELYQLGDTALTASLYVSYYRRLSARFLVVRTVKVIIVSIYLEFLHRILGK